MEFDINRVYTAKDADEVKVGSKVICSDTLYDLKNKVESGDIDYQHQLSSVEEEARQNRFNVSDVMFNLCYLVSEPEEKKLKWTDLKLGDVIKQGTISYVVTGIDTDPSTNKHIHTDGIWCLDSELEKWEKVE